MQFVSMLDFIELGILVDEVVTASKVLGSCPGVLSFDRKIVFR